MISELSNQNTTLHCFVDYPMFGIYSPRPVSAKSVLKRFWFTDAGMGATSNIFQELVYPLDGFGISGLPEGIVFPGLW
jgi:hypothetical protein